MNTFITFQYAWTRCCDPFNAKVQLGPECSILQDLYKEEDKDQTPFFPSENLAIILKMQFLLPNSNYMQKFALLTCQDYAQPVILSCSDTELWINFRFLTVLPLVQSLLCASFELKMERSLFAHRGRKAVKCFLSKLLTIFKCYSIAVNLYCLQELWLKIRNECVGCVLKEGGKGQLEKFLLVPILGEGTTFFTT